MKTYCVDFDDFCDTTLDTLDLLEDLKKAHPNFKVTLFTIPQRTSDSSIANAKARGDWLQLAPHGWRHTRGECLAWTCEEAVAKIKDAARRGIDAPVFRAPGWLLDGDVYQACRELGYAVASHSVYRIPNTGVSEYVYNMFRKRDLTSIHGHLTDCGFGYIKDMHAKGELHFRKGIFKFPQEVAHVVRAETACAL
jgi:hypothetical protein